MKLLVVGREGQLARSLLARSAAAVGIEVRTVGRPELDLEQPGSAARMIHAQRPDVVVNAAAYTAVDQAEQEPGKAFQINGAAAGEIAEAAHDVGARTIQLSTDYVFSGAADRPWRPDDATGPVNVYGASKLEGEERVRAATNAHLIVRTSWVFSPFGRNFVTTMLRMAQERDEIRVVDDQRGCPTSALDLADAILAAAKRWDDGGTEGLGTTMHVAGAGPCSWAGFAAAILGESKRQGGPWARVVPIPSVDFPTPARRPMYSVLDCESFERAFARPMRPWTETLPVVVADVLGRHG